MKNREYFLREDLDTFKRKFKAVCREKEFKVEKFGITYTIDRNPSPEKVARIRDSIAKRDEELKLMQELYAEGGMDKIIEYQNKK